MPNMRCQMRKGLDMCSICEREQREELRSKLAELLRIQPWLKYEDCLATINVIKYYLRL